MAFITTSDLSGSISTSMLNQLISAGANFANCLTTAISELAPLRTNFKIDAELDKSGTNRNDELLRIVVAITTYYLFNTVEDDAIPQRVIDNYTKAIKDIKAIADGKQGTTIERIVDENGTSKTSIRVNTKDEPRDVNYFWQ
jgi:phage gp36-like protein